MELDAQRRTGKYSARQHATDENHKVGVLNLISIELRHDKMLIVFASIYVARHTLDNLRKEKGDISKAISAKKKADKKANIEEESKKSKALDEGIKAQELATKEIEA